MGGDQDGDGKYAELKTDKDEPFLLLQQGVEHEPRIHLDIETDDIDAEVASPGSAGAKLLLLLKRRGDGKSRPAIVFARRAQAARRI